MSLNARGTAKRMEMVQVDGRKLRTPSEVYKYALVKFLVEHLVGIYIMSPGHSVGKAHLVFRDLLNDG